MIIIIIATVSYCLKNISFSPAGVVVGAGMVVDTENNENEWTSKFALLIYDLK